MRLDRLRRRGHLDTPSDERIDRNVRLPDTSPDTTITRIATQHAFCAGGSGGGLHRVQGVNR